MLYDYIQLTASVGEPEKLINEDDSVFATRFPSTQNNLPPKFECLDGEEGLVMDDIRGFYRGYQIGYDSNVVPRMSGGVFDHENNLSNNGYSTSRYNKYEHEAQSSTNTID